MTNHVTVAKVTWLFINLLRSLLPYLLSIWRHFSPYLHRQPTWWWYINQEWCSLAPTCPLQSNTQNELGEKEWTTSFTTPCISCTLGADIEPRCCNTNLCTHFKSAISLARRLSWRRGHLISWRKHDVTALGTDGLRYPFCFLIK